MKRILLGLALLAGPAWALDWVWVTPHGYGPIGTCSVDDKSAALADAKSKTEALAVRLCGGTAVKYVSDLDPPDTWCEQDSHKPLRARAFLSERWECLEEPR